MTTMTMTMMCDREECGRRSEEDAKEQRNAAECDKFSQILASSVLELAAKQSVALHLYRTPAPVSGGQRERSTRVSGTAHVRTGRLLPPVNANPGPVRVRIADMLVCSAEKRKHGSDLLSLGCQGVRVALPETPNVCPGRGELPGYAAVTPLKSGFNMTRAPSAARTVCQHHTAPCPTHPRPQPQARACPQHSPLHRPPSSLQPPL
eukprot:2515431-Rhodomonas_salina.1